MGISLVGNALPFPPISPKVWSPVMPQELKNFKEESGVWGKSVMESVKEVNQMLDDSCFEKDHRVIPDVSLAEREPVGPEDADYINEQKSIAGVIAEAGKVLDEADTSSIDDAFLQLMSRARSIGALHMETRLLELHREMLALVSADAYDDEDDENDDEFYALMP
jgi:hypothetical protein